MTAGVGAADPESSSCREWPIEEVRRHCSRDDAWMVLRGLVYDVTRYLRYHPGSVEEMLRAAGDDGTALFDEVHPWVNASAILQPCCIGRLAAPRRMDEVARSEEDSMHPDEWRPFRLISTAAAARDSVLLRFELRGPKNGSKRTHAIFPTFPTRHTPISPTHHRHCFSHQEPGAVSGSSSASTCS